MLRCLCYPDCVCNVTLAVRDIEIVVEKSGIPEVRIEKPGFHDLQMKLGLSHCKDKAIAFAVVANTK